jgi:hypothetical protein
MAKHIKETDKAANHIAPAAEADVENDVPAADQGGGVAVDESDEHMHDIDSLKSMVENLQRDRKYHEDSLSEIDKGLMEARGLIDEITGDSTEPEPSGNQGSRTRATRSGKETGTSILLRILRENKGSMEAPDLLHAGEGQGVTSAYSSLYSLQQTKKVFREGRTIKLPPESASK